MSKQMPQKSRLGRGLSSLMNSSIGDTPISHVETSSLEARPTDVGQPAGAITSSMPAGTSLMELAVAELAPNPHQPRREFNEGALKELAASLKTTGLIQPVVARQIDGGGFELIAGERRWRAAKIAGLTTLPVILKKVDPIMQAQMALVENLQRADLNPIERADAYNTLLKNLGLTHAELADRLGEDRSIIGHYIRLVDLPKDVQTLIATGQLSLGHAKVLAGISSPVEQSRLAKLVVEQGLNIRNLERVINTPQQASPATPAASEVPSAHLVDLEKSLSRQLGLRAQVKAGKKKGTGRLVLHFANLDQFDDLMARLGLATE